MCFTMVAGCNVKVLVFKSIRALFYDLTTMFAEVNIMLDNEVAKFENEQVEVKREDYTIEVSVTSDYCQAYVTVKGGSGIQCLEKEALMDALRAKKVTYGIDMDAVNRIIETPQWTDHVLVAQGIPLKNGNDGSVTYFVEEHAERKPKMLEDGSVDYKNATNFQLVEEGQVLAERVAPTGGIDGMSVTGRAIKAKPGKAASFNGGKNTHLSEDGLKLIASKAGIIDFTGGAIEVVEILVIQGDVGIETGHIQFSGKVVVHGNVTSGYKIISDEGIEIYGVVESAILKSQGDIFIRNGVQGKDTAYIECDGDLQSSFLNNCHVKVKGKIEVDSILHCHIQCDDSVIVKGKRGHLIGGSLMVKKEIEAKVIGSEMGTLTTLNLGVDNELLEHYQALIKTINEYHESLNKLKHAMDLLTKQMEIKPENINLADLLQKTLASKKQYDADLVMLEKQRRSLRSLIESLKRATVRAEILHPGVKVKIGYANFKVMDLHEGVKLMLNNDKITAYVQD